MPTFEERLEDAGFHPAQIDGLAKMVDEEAKQRSFEMAGDLLHRVFIRVDLDSPFGRALSRALGFTGETSLERAAKDFGVTKQYLHELQQSISAKLGSIGIHAASESERQSAA